MYYEDEADYEAERNAELQAELAYERHLEDAGRRLDPAGYAAEDEAMLHDPQLNGEAYEIYEPGPYTGDDPDYDNFCSDAAPFEDDAYESDPDDLPF